MSVRSDIRLDQTEARVTTLIQPPKGWVSLGLKELWQYRDLFYFLVWRDIKVRYVQSVLGIGWALIQPLMMMVVFTVVFGKLMKVGSDGAPYAIFSYVALVPWTYFSTSLSQATASLTKNAAMVSKIYFPRLIMPLSSVLGRLVDFSVALLLVFGMMAWFRIIPTIWIVTLPLLVLLMMLTVAGLGMWLTALAVQYRDISLAMGFVVRLLMYASPVVYPASLIPDQYRLFYALNPMVGVIEGFRSALLDTNPMPWDLIAIGGVIATAAAISGALYFRRMERNFADVV